jgi:hypothetical protein
MVRLSSTTSTAASTSGRVGMAKPEAARKIEVSGVDKFIGFQMIES